MCPHKFSFENFLDTFTYFQTETSALVVPKEGEPWARLTIALSLDFEGFPLDN
jgi:hypothetical protein